MDELELDEWFNERRDELESEFINSLQKSKDHEKARVQFDKKYSNLIKEFQEKQKSMYDNKKRIHDIQAPWIKFKLWFVNLFEKIGLLYDKIKESIRKWFFERKIKKILRDKSDLDIKGKF